MATSVWLDESECTRDGGLPPVCMKCGAEAHQTVRKTFSWCPSWVIVLILAGLLIWLIVQMILTKRMRVYVPLCHEHKGMFMKRALLTTLIVFLGLGVLAVAIAIPVAFEEPGGRAPDWMGFSILGGGAVMLVLLIVAAIVSKAGIGAAEITDRDIRLKGVHEDFKEALIEQRRVERDERDRRKAERAERRGAGRDEDDDYDDRPRRRSRYED